MLVDVPYSLSGKAEHVFFRGVAVLVEVPIRVFVILVVAVPVLVVAVGILVVFEPSLVICAGECHEVFADVALRVSECWTVFHIFACVVCGEVKVNWTRRSVYAEVEVIAAHVSVWQDVLVAHVGEREAHASLTRVDREDGRVLRGETRAEEVRRVVRMHHKRVFLAVEILIYEVVGFRSPAGVGARGARCGQFAAVAHTIDLLDVVPLGELAVDGE